MQRYFLCIRKSATTLQRICIYTTSKLNYHYININFTNKTSKIIFKETTSTFAKVKYVLNNEYIKTNNSMSKKDYIIVH